MFRMRGADFNGQQEASVFRAAVAVGEHAVRGLPLAPSGGMGFGNGRLRCRDAGQVQERVMRKKLLGAVAALVAGTGGALAQSPTRGPAGGRFGGPDGGVHPAQYNTPIPPPLPEGAGLPSGLPEGLGGMPGGPMGPGGPDGGPQWPVPGPYMEQSWQKPPPSGGLRGGEGGLFGGLAGKPTTAPTVWFNGEYLLMFPKSLPVGFPLVTTGAPAGLGTLGQGATSALHGGGDLSLGAASGFRLTAGFFRPQDHRLGLEVTGMYISPTSNDFFGASANNGVPVLARPFFNAATGQSAALIVSFPNFSSGSILSRATSQFWGIEANAVANMYRTGSDSWIPGTMNAIVGFRHANLAEGLTVSQQSQLLPGNTAPYAGITVAAPTSLLVQDQFLTSNEFYAGQLGLQWQATLGRWHVSTFAKVGLGLMHQEVRINGMSGSMDPTAVTGMATQSIGGLYANASNIGTYRDDRFGVMTDVNATIGYNVTRYFTITAGYNFLHLNTVARPTNQFNGTVDPAIIPTSGAFGAATTATPPYAVKDTDYWMHGLNFGFIARY